MKKFESLSADGCFSATLRTMSSTRFEADSFVEFSTHNSTHTLFMRTKNKTET